MVDLARTRFPDDTTKAGSLAFGEALESQAGELVKLVKRYARDRPMSFALWSFGVGFVLGWKLKPW